MKNCSKIQFVAAEADLLEEKIASHLKEFKQSNLELRQKWNKLQSKKCESEIYPTYQTKTFSFLNFGQLCYQNCEVYSDVIEANGV